MSPRAVVALALLVAAIAAWMGGALMRKQAPLREQRPIDMSRRTPDAGRLETGPKDGGIAPSSAIGSVTPIGSGRAPTPIIQDSIESVLSEASIEKLKPSGDRSKGLFLATLTAFGGATYEAIRVELAMAEDPYSLRRTLAFSRLAKALGASVVPVCVLRKLGVGELAARTVSDANQLAFWGAHASIQNDGTIDALFCTPQAGSNRTQGSAFRRVDAGSREVAVHGASEIELWASWAQSIVPVPTERASLRTGYVEMVVLDYLSANGLRRSLRLDETNGSLSLFDNGSAFPDQWNAQAEALLLARVRDIQRFPRALFEGLQRFDRAAARAALAPGSFDTWLVSPRTLVALDERRASVLSLIQARIAESGEALVLKP